MSLLPPVNPSTMLTFDRIRYKDGKVEVFDIRERAYRGGYSYTKKQKRIFHRTFSGLQVGFYKKQYLLFLTLTTQYDVTKKKEALQIAEEEMNNDWQKFKQNIDYQVQKWRFDQWITQTYGPVNLESRQGQKFYKERRKNAAWSKTKTMWEHFKFKLTYLKVRTTEGGGVLHVLIRKAKDIPMIAQEYLKREWDRIHGAEQVWIEEIKVDPSKGLSEAMNASFYFCGNYFNQQPVVRQSSSYDWIFKGAAAVWSRGKNIFGFKKRKHTYHPACSCAECLHTNPRNPQRKNPYESVRMEDTPNVLLKRPSLIQIFMNSRKSLRRDSGYDNALFQWLLLTRHPPKDTRQLKLKKFLEVN